ncbi:predicted protein [Lichtheimia corymbifera JMRC:FSU:9682]|uniref:Uncharacterized protein n=1 Tax=Lichtheimia corymbifera JMRC:FSU:9682 TaxID=1263082 RepID=A0A068S4B2_9FUNG|nr:predicted protein [Lichtheimia corymbifera JMRC:FSU:9682]
MSLLLTRTCEYAILVALQKGRYFSHSTEHDICIQSKLELRLPAAVDDLIPPTTIISTPPATISREGTVTLNTTLAYLISTKLLQRLRTHDAEITLTVDAVGVDAGQQRIGTARLRVSEAKMVVHHGGHMDKVNRFVADRGDWQTLSDGRRNKEQLKAGLFIVAMPTEKSQQASPAMAPSPSSALLELKSLGDLSNASTPLLFSDSVTTTTVTTLLSSPSSHSFLNNNNNKLGRHHVDLNIDQLANEFRSIKLKHQPQPSVSSRRQQQQQQQIVAKEASSKHPHYHQIGKGTKPYTLYFRIVDTDYVNLRDLSEMSMHRYRGNSGGSSRSRPGTAASIGRHHQQRGVAHKPFFTYSILSNVVHCPAASISHSSTTKAKSSSTTWPTCFHLRGHLVDIQNWLDDLRFLEVSLVMKDTTTTPSDDHDEDDDDDMRGDDNTNKRLFSDRMTVMGMAHIPLSNLAFYRNSRGHSHHHHHHHQQHYYHGRGHNKDATFVERTFPVHDLNHHRWWEQQEGAPSKQNKTIAKMTVRLGLVSGWWAGEDEKEEEDQDNNNNNNDDITHDKHHHRRSSSNNNKTFIKRPSTAHDLLDWFKKKKAKIPSSSTS